MNKDRRKAIEALKDRIGEISALAADLRTEVEALRDEEQEYFDGMPESFQNGEKGQALRRLKALSRPSLSLWMRQQPNPCSFPCSSLPESSLGSGG